MASATRKGPALESVEQNYGDKIFATYQGTVAPGTEPNQLIGKTTFDITGGTGRFASDLCC